MRKVLRRTAVPLLLAALVVGAGNPAVAKPADPPSSDLRWTVADTTPDMTPSPQTAGRNAPLAASANTQPNPRTIADDPETRARTASDLKQECQQRPEARTVQGWLKSRFEQCFIGHRKVELRCRGCTTAIASIEFDYTLLAFAYDGSRRVDYVLTFDRWLPLGGPERETSIMRVGFSGCSTATPCNPSPAEREVPLSTWRQTPHFEATFTSPNTQGTGDYLVWNMLSAMEMSIDSLNPDIEPWHEGGMTFSRVRFDTAGAVAGKQAGTVFDDFVPTFDLWTLAGQYGEQALIPESARHIRDALKNPQRTFPSFVGKNIPGQSRPLHRITGPGIEANRARAGAVCEAVWGPRPHPGQDCDEYPFASTKEGASTSTSDSNPDWHGSARLIDALDNQRAGGVYLNTRFYNVHRILPEYVVSGTVVPGDAFFVASSL